MQGLIAFFLAVLEQLTYLLFISGCHSLLHCSLFISPTQAAAYLEEALGGWGVEESEGNASEEVA